MNQSDLILEFIDGTLDNQLEQGLFDEMARHPELRAELRQYVMIGDAVRGDREAYGPSAETERRLLGGLGMLPLAEAGAGGTAAVIGSSTGAGGGAAAAAGSLILAKLKGAILPLLLGFVVGSLLTGGGVYVAMNDSDSPEYLAGESAGIQPVESSSVDANSLASTSIAERNGNAGSSVAGPEGERTNETVRHSVGNAGGSNEHLPTVNTRKGQGGNKPTLNGPNPIVAQKELLQGRTDKEASQQPLPNQVANDADLENGSGTRAENAAVWSRAREENRMNYGAPVDTRIMDNEDLENAVRESEEAEASRSPKSGPAPEFSPDAEPTFEDRQTWAFEYRSTQWTTPFVNNDALDARGNFFVEDFAIGGYYSPASAWYIGAEGGRERFAQRLYYGKGDTVFIEQRPLISWMTGTAGLNFTLLNKPVFVQGSAGVSEHGGPMFRGRIGTNALEWLPAQFPTFLNMPVSLEASSLVYTYNGQYLTTGNWGLTWGLGVKF